MALLERGALKLAILAAGFSMHLSSVDTAGAVWFEDNYDYLGGRSNRTTSSSTPRPKTGVNETVPIMFITLSSLGLLLNVVCIVETLIAKKYRQNVKYALLLNYLLLKVIYSVFLCLALLSRSWIYESKFYIRPTNPFCKMINFTAFFCEMTEVFLLMAIWLTILSERNLVGLQSFFLISAPTAGPPASVNSNNKASKKSLILAILAFYLANFVACGVMSASTYAWDYSSWSTGKKQIYCVLSSGPSFAIIAGFAMIFLPVTYALFIFSTLFWGLFGGRRDPLLDKLSLAELDFLKLFKLMSLLKAIEMFFLDSKSSAAFKLSPSVLELLRTMGLFVIIISAILYIYYERVLQSIGQSVRGTRQPLTTSRVNLFRQNSLSSEVNYAKLVENGHPYPSQTASAEAQ